MRSGCVSLFCGSETQAKKRHKKKQNSLAHIRRREDITTIWLNLGNCTADCLAARNVPFVIRVPVLSLTIHNLADRRFDGGFKELQIWCVVCKNKSSRRTHFECQGIFDPIQNIMKLIDGIVRHFFSCPTFVFAWLINGNWVHRDGDKKNGTSHFFSLSLSANGLLSSSTFEAFEWKKKTKGAAVWIQWKN